MSSFCHTRKIAGQNRPILFELGQTGFNDDLDAVFH